MLNERNVLGMPQPEGFPGSAAVGTLAPNKLLWRPAIGSALVAGMLAVVGTSIPIVPLMMLCTFAAGGLAVTLYRRRAGYFAVTPWMGAKLGLLAGGWGFGLRTLLSTVALFGSSERRETRNLLQQKLQEAAAAAADPDARRMAEQFRDFIATDHGLIIVVLVFLAIAAMFFLIFSALGGALGAALFGRESRGKQP
jgi:hypothetical protein